MKKTSFFLAILCGLTVMTSLASCAKDNIGNCGAGYSYDASYRNADGTFGACMYVGTANPGLTVGGTTTGQTVASPNTTLTASIAYPDMNQDGLVDQPGSNTLAGNNSTVMDASNWKMVRMGDLGISGFGAADYAIISTQNVALINANLAWNAVANVFKPNTGAGTVVFQWVYGNGLEYGSTSYGQYGTYNLLNGLVGTGYPCAGTRAYYYVTGYSIQ